MPTFEDVPLPGTSGPDLDHKLSRREAARVKAEHFDRLERAAEALERVREALALDVASARAEGLSWQDVGEALGIDRETARRRFGE